MSIALNSHETNAKQWPKVSNPFNSPMPDKHKQISLYSPHSPDYHMLVEMQQLAIWLELLGGAINSKIPPCSST
jgi:hypothetical protein